MEQKKKKSRIIIQLSPVELFFMNPPPNFIFGNKFGMWIQWYYSSILNLKKFWIFWMICEHCWSTFWYGSSCKSSLNPLPFYWRTTRGELFPKWMLMIMMFARYLVVSPASFVNWLPSARTAIRNWYIDIEASIAILRPTIWIIQKHFFSHSF